MDAGEIAIEAAVPLDAPDFRFELAGHVGPMPASALNRYLSLNQSFEFKEGEVDRIDFAVSAKGGRSVAVVTPRYHDLSVDPTGDGGGVVGEVARGVKKFIANTFVVRSRNPDEHGKNRRTGHAVRHYDIGWRLEPRPTAPRLPPARPPAWLPKRARCRPG